MMHETYLQKGDIPMKAIVNPKATVNGKLLSLLFALVIVLHIVASGLAPSHSFLGMSLALLEDIGWLCIGLIWVITFTKSMRRWGPKTWATVRMRVRMRRQARKEKKENTFVPVEKLKYLQNDVQRLGLALQGLRPEQEQARRLHSRMHGDATPSLILSPQHTALSAEFQCLVRLLNHFGFSSLERMQLRQRDLAFIQQWGSDLEARLRQHQKRSWEQQAALRIALATVAQQQQKFGETHAFAQYRSDYQQIKGALRVLENLANDQRCPWDLVQSTTQRLQSDLDTLTRQFEQTRG